MTLCTSCRDGLALNLGALSPVYTYCVGGANIREVILLSAEAGISAEAGFSAEAGVSAEAGGLGINTEGFSDITAIPDITWDVGKDRFSDEAA